MNQQLLRWKKMKSRKPNALGKTTPFKAFKVRGQFPRETRFLGSTETNPGRRRWDGGVERGVCSQSRREWGGTDMWAVEGWVGKKGPGLGVMG